jgi:hypothetical protein
MATGDSESLWRTEPKISKRDSHFDFTAFQRNRLHDSRIHSARLLYRVCGETLLMGRRCFSRLWRQVCFSETMVSTYESTRRHNPEQRRHSHRSENLKSHVLMWSSGITVYFSQRNGLIQWHMPRHASRPGVCNLFKTAGHIEKYEARCGPTQALEPNDLNTMISLAISFSLTFT